jgi:hypothetical protein
MKGEELIGQLGDIGLSRRAPHEKGISMVNWHTSLFMVYITTLSLARAVQSVPGGKVSILGDRGIVHFKKNVYMYMCPIPSRFRDRAISLYSTLYTVQTSNTPCPHTSCKVP